MGLDPHPFDPAALIAETVELVADKAGAKKLTITQVSDRALPRAVLADGARARQVLLNLLTNAVKFTREGTVEVSSRYLAEGGGQLRVSVRDTGVGIPDERLPKLFQRFSQGDGSISREFGGTGLGLAIARDLAELMGGTVGVESVEGQGSTFWFTIAAPLAPEPAAVEVPA
jgi:signal transduction histidine kinase